MKYVAFLRGINVGGRIIKMNDLKLCCEKAGLLNVVTILQTGNVVFESNKKDLKDMLEKELQKTFGYPAKVQIRSLDVLQEIIRKYPFKSSDNKQDYVIFMENGLESALYTETVTEDADLEQYKAGKSVMYWQVNKGSTLKSPFSKLLTKAKYKDFNTNRNLKTLKKIIASASS